MGSSTGMPEFTSRPAGRWPGRPLLVARLREILHREFDASDAWVVHTPGRCRLEARVGWRVVVLHEGCEESFWAPFYTTAVRNRCSGGHLVGDLAPTQRRRRDLLEVVRELWSRAAPTSQASAPPVLPN